MTAWHPAAPCNAEACLQAIHERTPTQPRCSWPERHPAVHKCTPAHTDCSWAKRYLAVRTGLLKMLPCNNVSVSYTHLRAHETLMNL
eukprot:224786-Chlamydomonas_euryale.AAC.2